MSAFIDYIIRHSYYKEVNSTYILAKEHHTEAFSLWLQDQTQTIGDDYESKKYVHAHIQEIKRLDNCIRIVKNAIRSSKKSVEWFFHDRGLSTIPILTYKEYKQIADNINVIQQYESYIQEYNNLLIVQGEAVSRFIGNSVNNHTYDQIKSIASSKNEIWRIGNILKKAHACEKKYTLAWKIFAHGRIFANIPLNDLETIEEGNFQKKEEFVKFYKHSEKLCNVIMGELKHDIDSFDQEVLEKEEYCMLYVRTQSLYIQPYNGKVQTEGKELKRAILDSIRYGTDVNFVDKFTISEFYQLRQEADNLGIGFDAIISKVKDNDGAIKAFNYEKSGKSVVYIQDYIPASKVGTPLYNYIETYREQKEKRDSARRIASCYPLGFACHFDSNLDFESCDFSLILMILNSEQRIIESEREELEKKRKRQEEERKRQELRDLRSCVSNWPQPNRSSVNCFSLYYYYPTTCDWDASEDEWDVRNLIWDFKAKPHNYRSESEINQKHTNSVNKVLPDIEKVLRHSFGSNVSKLTFVPILASTRLVSERRYKDISFQLSNNLGMSNGYPYMSITKDGISKNDPTNTTGVSIQPEISLDGSFFKDRYVILFDDVITSGKSMERFKRLLESAGATVIGGLSIGKTKHERQGTNPIDNI